MRKVVVSAAIVIVGSVPLAAAPRFSASDVAKPQRRLSNVAIRNNAKAITAYEFFGDIHRALFSLKSSRSLASHPFGASVYNSSAAVTAIPPELAAIVREAAAKHGVDPRLVAAVAHQESRFNPSAVSPVGALGLMQLMPQTARFLGVTNALDPRENVMAGTKYLRTLLDTFHGDLDLTLAAYNAGPGAVQRYGGVPPYRETMNYVASIRRNYQAALLQ